MNEVALLCRRGPQVHARRVRVRMMDAPWWVLALVTGIPFGTIMAVSDVVGDDDSFADALIGSAVGAVFFGVFMGLFLARANSKARAAVGEVPPGREATVYRSALKGPVPGDPAERAAAARFVAHQLDETRRNAWWTLVVFVTILIGSAWLAVSSSPLWWFAVAMWAGCICWALWLPSRLRRRLTELEA